MITTKQIHPFDKHIINDGNNAVVEQMNPSELLVGRLLGEGAFSQVREVSIKSRRSCNSSDNDSTTSDSSSETSVSDGGATELAVKFLKPSVAESELESAATSDLVFEARLLASLTHKHIVGIHGVPDNCVAGGYFLIMDRLTETVEQLISKWCQAGEPSIRSRLESVTLPVARAMEYLHDNNIVFRDLKPSNIGFDRHGTVKLFDFGLSRRISSHSDNQKRRLTGRIGSLRYMAPEVAKQEQYGLPADVYSYGLLLWELSSLQRPFEDIPLEEFGEKVVFGRVRPAMDSTWSPSLQRLIKKCWDASPKRRPEFSAICEKIQSEISDNDKNSSRSRKRAEIPSANRKRKLHKWRQRMFSPQ